MSEMMILVAVLVWMAVTVVWARQADAVAATVRVETESVMDKALSQAAWGA